jgi:hypothetical protein
MLRDLEKARANLCERSSQNENEHDKENVDNLPLEEMKYIEWKSDSSDEERFQIITSRKTKKNKRKIQKQKERCSRGKSPSSI